MADRSVVLERSFGVHGRRSGDARLTAEGDLVVEVQDLGPQVRGFGSDVGEYEFAWTIRHGDAGALVEALGGAAGADVLAQLIERFASVSEFERYLLRT